MLYQLYDLQDDLVGPFRVLADGIRNLAEPLSWGFGGVMKPHATAGLEMVSRLALSHARPEFGITEARVGDRLVPVTEKVVLDLPFAKLLRFAKDVEVPQPPVLIVAPLSGHFSTLLRGTVASMVGEHDVYITDWANARDVPVAAGRFGVDEYIDYLVRFMEALGNETHVLAVCQPCVQVLAAVAIMSEDGNPATPRSMTLMAGPIDPRENPTVVNRLAVRNSLRWFERNTITRVPHRYLGGGRRVYPGFVQLMAFVMMNVSRHQAAHRRLYWHLTTGETDEADALKRFYDEYFTVLDLTEEFYLETIERVFKRADIARGEFEYRGRPVDPGAIRDTALLTIEGGRDDICAVGQTAAAHDLCASLPRHRRRHHLQPDVGHFGTFSGRRWRDQIYPVVRDVIRSAC